MGFKVTPQRRYIFQALEGNRDHPSADGVYDMVLRFMPDISLATVYNTLRELVDLGEVRELDLGEGKSRYDPDTGRHQHLICVGCQEVVDVFCPSQCTELVPGEQHGYRILGADVTFYGLCPVCEGEGDQQWPQQITRQWGVPVTA